MRKSLGSSRNQSVRRYEGICDRDKRCAGTLRSHYPSARFRRTMILPARSRYWNRDFNFDGAKCMRIKDLSLVQKPMALFYAVICRFETVPEKFFLVNFMSFIFKHIRDILEQLLEVSSRHIHIDAIRCWQFMISMPKTGALNQGIPVSFAPVRIGTERKKGAQIMNLTSIRIGEQQAIILQNVCRKGTSDSKREILPDYSRGMYGYLALYRLNRRGMVQFSAGTANKVQVSLTELGRTALSHWEERMS